MIDIIGLNTKRYNPYKDKPTFNFHRKKLIYEYNPEKCKEEQPTFTFENDKNVKYYKSYIENQTKAIDKYSQNYINYMHNENKIFKNLTPYHSKFNNNYNIFNINSSINNISKTPKINNKDNYFMKGRSYEISNPDKYYNINSNDYNKFHNEEIRYYDYNQNMMNNRTNELNVNPYNKESSRSDLGKSNLRRNPILFLLHDYSYNKYFDKEFYNNYNNNINETERIKNSLIQAGSNSIYGN
jgi:hypothetical protein